MSITDELREYAQIAFDKGSAGRARVESIADRIDAAHCKALGETAAAAYAEGAESVPIAVDENAWVRLPVDADGVTIHPGDRLDGYNKVIEVVELRHGRSGWVIISRDGNGYADTAAFTHLQQTVEDVLQKMLEQAVGYSDAHTTVALSTIAEYAARLRLAGGDA